MLPLISRGHPGWALGITAVTDYQITGELDTYRVWTYIESRILCFFGDISHLYPPAELHPIMEFQIRYVIVILLATILLYFIVQATRTNSRFNVALRNNGAGSSYSMAKSQLMWWTIIVLMCFAIAYAETGVVKNLLNSSCLILLGISLGTTTAGKVVDNVEEANPQVYRHQNTRPPRQFLVDIVSDRNGVNLHRFQALLFNLLYGVIFVIQFFDSGAIALPEFGTTALGLLGLSSTGYIVLKANENPVTPNQQYQGVAPPVSQPTAASGQFGAGSTDTSSQPAPQGQHFVAGSATEAADDSSGG